MKTDPSHFFNGIEQVLYSDSANKSLQALENLVRNDGASEESIDSIVDAALRDFIYECLPKGEANNALGQEKTFGQWVDFFTKTIQGISKERIKTIMEYMHQKGYLIEDESTGFMYRGTAPLGRRPLYK